jgi:RimJ/RimL family protein N-acetyltransferase
MFRACDSLPYRVNTGFPITQAVADGSQQGVVYAYENNFFVVHHAGFCSLVQDGDCLEQLVVLFRQKETPQYFHIYDAGDKLIDGVRQFPELFNIRLRKRVQLQYVDNNSPVLLPSAKDYIVKNVGPEDLSALSIFKLDLDKRFWNGSSDFLEHANAVAVFNVQGEPAGVCYAAAVAANKAEIDVFTGEEYRGKGLAKLVVSAFVKRCLEKGLKPNWDCFEDNAGSVRTALSIGFKQERNYLFLSVYNKLK